MRYIDSNVFIYAAIGEGPIGEQARATLRRVLRAGACTSALTIDEVLWVMIKQLKDRPTACQKIRELLQLDLVIHPVERRDMDAALEHVEGGLDPRDAIHAAVALRRDCKAIVSSDPDFSDVAGIKHESLE